MGFKELFINPDGNSDDEPKKDAPVVETPKTKFPSATTKFPSEANKGENTTFFGKASDEAPMPEQTQVVNQMSNEHLDKAYDIYQKAFDNLNKSGYDFYEFYQTVTSGGATNAQIYPMAFAMGSAMDKTITKDKLLQQSDYYISEINKTYNNYVTQGNNKKQELVNQKDSENQSLLGELNSMEKEFEQLRLKIQDRKDKLSAIGTTYEPNINEIDSKLIANDMAKNKIIQSIEQVKQGIANNIK